MNTTGGGKSSDVGRLTRLRQAGQNLGKETRQRKQKLNKNVRESASFLARGVSNRRRNSRMRMET